MPESLYHKLQDNNRRMAQYLIAGHTIQIRHQDYRYAVVGAEVGTVPCADNPGQETAYVARLSGIFVRLPDRWLHKYSLDQILEGSMFRVEYGEVNQHNVELYDNDVISTGMNIALNSARARPR